MINIKCGEWISSGGEPLPRLLQLLVDLLQRELGVVGHVRALRHSRPHHARPHHASPHVGRGQTDWRSAAVAEHARLEFGRGCCVPRIEIGGEGSGLEADGWVVGDGGRSDGGRVV